MLKIERENLGEVIIYRCRGAIVRGAEADHLQEAVTAEAARSIVLDLEQVEAVDAAGLGVLVYLYHWSLQSGAQLAIANVGPRVRALVELTNLDSVLPLEQWRPESAAPLPLHAA